MIEENKRLADEEMRRKAEEAKKPKELVEVKAKVDVDQAQKEMENLK